MKSTRILLDEMPNMLREILGHVLGSMPGMTLVDRMVDGADLLAAVRLTRANVVLAVKRADDERGTYAPLLSQRPRLRIIAVADDGSTGLLYELRAQRITLGEMSADILSQAVQALQGTITGSFA